MTIGVGREAAMKKLLTLLGLALLCLAPTARLF